ncbi:hypothetical protein CcrColossus_gp188 [Caulobacter phage CcrColossus]|uniref:Nucleoside 2-deoxyribosyltransferase n=1 Tax=Caulobacter phage CcrColossus TaxID=1211640 RepID=K4JW05_9CAUD|nr:hypothetical protein CcrColossus_gp188 [Caulobacter phage CcrColossus]AFU88058.1 hypothetical protein CcrColossus_gp188 [Caulobacter phage CcrColossus]
MTQIIKPTLRRYKTTNQPSVFLAGSIEMGTASPWHDEVAEHLNGYASLVYNPRRDDWDSTWVQEIGAEQFNAQVNWELDMIEAADAVFFYFEPNTKSPITLLELGIVAASKPARAVVVCPAGFWRKGNVDIVCERAGLPVRETIDEGLKRFQALLGTLI